MPSEKALRTRNKILEATRVFIMREGVAALSIDKKIGRAHV